MRYCLSTLYKCAHSKRAQLTVTVLQLDAGGNAQGYLLYPQLLRWVWLQKH